MAEKTSERAKRTFKLEMLTDVRGRAFVSCTIQPNGKVMGFHKFEIELEGNIPDDVDKMQALDVIYHELSVSATVKEAAIKATYGNPAQMDELVLLLRSLLSNKGEQTSGTGTSV